MRHPDEILTDFDAGCQGLADIDMRGLLYEILEDVAETVRLADRSPNDEAFVGLTDYLVNYYGDD